MIKQVKKVWGTEQWLVNEPEYCAKKMILVKGYRCSIHYHKEKTETFYIVGGRVKVFVKLKSKDTLIGKVFSKGESVKINKGLYHTFFSLTRRSVMLEVSTHHDDDDSYRYDQSGKVKGELINAKHIEL